ncbi:alpha/beta hydrolase [Actinomadura miaoliensis]|uniref:alpha/beta fold hydrolase n=1 Tax=Actinomadura miaoliensis TaxID=430685 RepID=UPI0031E54C44
MTDIHVTVWDDSGGSAQVAAVFVHGVISWGTDDRYGFGAQRPLADSYRLLMVDRRGHGASPDIDRTDYEVDADDIVGLLTNVPGGAHLVGHSYGGVAAMLAAARRPDLVRSLTLIQPGALRPAADHPVVAEALRRSRQATAELPPDLSPEDYLRMSTEGLGLPMPEPTPERLRATRAAMRERPCWDADVPLQPLADASWPTLIITGTWEDAPEAYRRYAGEPLLAAADFIADRIGAERLRVPGFYPHTEQPALINDALRDLWRRVDTAS